MSEIDQAWTCSCGATAPAYSEGWRYTDAAWCPKHGWLA